MPPTAPTTLAAYQADLTPFQGRWGRAWALSVGASKDVTVERARQAVLAGAVTRAPADALPLLGADVSLERLPGELDTSYRSRIAGAWEAWRFAGTRTAVETVLVQLGYSDARVATAHDLGRVPWAQWWAFLTLGGDPVTRRTWDTGSTWGSGVWGSSAGRDDVRRTRRALRRFSNARDRGWVVLLQSTPGVWGAPATWGTGTWGARNPRWRI